MTEPDPKAPEGEDNSVKKPEITPPVKDNEDIKAKMADQARRHAEQMAGSRNEVASLKADIEEMKAKIEEGTPGSKETLGDIELFKQYCREAGVPFKEDLKSLEQNQNQKDMKVTQDEAVEKFLEQYPEYMPESDTDNSKWEKLMAEYSSYKTPSTPTVTNWLKLIKKAHTHINKDNSLEKGKSLGKAEVNLAEQAKLGGSGGGSTKKSTERTPEQQAMRDEFKKVRPEAFKEEKKE